MQKELVRLECLKLCHRFDYGPAKVVEAAKVYESYILENTESDTPSVEATDEALATQPAGASRKKKKVDNSILD